MVTNSAIWSMMIYWICVRRLHVITKAHRWSTISKQSDIQSFLIMRSCQCTRSKKRELVAEKTYFTRNTAPPLQPYYPLSKISKSEWSIPYTALKLAKKLMKDAKVVLTSYLDYELVCDPVQAKLQKTCPSQHPRQLSKYMVRSDCYQRCGTKNNIMWRGSTPTVWMCRSCFMSSSW